MSPISVARSLLLAKGMDLGTTLEFAVGDITQELSDAIVNPAGPGLVDQAVRQAAGPLIVDELHENLHARGDGRLLPGRAIVTRGFGLAARHAIHCGPPVYFDGPLRARADLAACHIQALRLARERGFASISLPAVGTGAYRYPLPEAAEIAVRTVVAELAAHDRPLRVRFVLADEAALRCYAGAAPPSGLAPPRPLGTISRPGHAPLRLKGDAMRRAAVACFAARD